MTAFAQKLIWTVLAVAIYAMAAWPAMASVAGRLEFVAGLIIGAVWIVRPCVARLIDIGRKSIRPPPHP